jgi:colicin import membrane protein
MGRNQSQISGNQIVHGVSPENLDVEDKLNLNSVEQNSDMTVYDDSQQDECRRFNYEITDDITDLEISGQIETDPSVITTQRAKKADIIRQKEEQEARKQQELHKVHPPNNTNRKKKDKKKRKVRPPIEPPPRKVIAPRRRKKQKAKRHPYVIDPDPQHDDQNTFRLLRGRLKAKNVAQRREDEQRRLEQMICEKEEAAEARLSQLMEITYKALMEEQVRKKRRAEEAARRRAQAEKTQDDILKRSVAKTEAASKRRAMILKQRGQSMAEKNADRWLKKRFAEQRMQQEERRRLAALNDRMRREAVREWRIEKIRAGRQRKKRLIERTWDAVMRGLI